MLALYCILLLMLTLSLNQEGFVRHATCVIVEEGMPNPQTLLFSATLPAWVKKTAEKYMKTMPPVIDLVGNSLNQTATNVTVGQLIFTLLEQQSDSLSKCFFYLQWLNFR